MSDMQKQSSGADAYNSAERTYQLGNMDCANCAQEVEAGVRHLKGVDAVRVDFIGGKLHLIGSVDFETLRKRVESLGKTIHLNDEGGSTGADVTRAGGVVGFWHYLTARRETMLALIGGGMITVTLLASLWGMPSVLRDGLYVVGMAVALLPILQSGVNGLRINRQMNINLLMSIAAVGAVAIGEYLEGAVVIFLFAIGEALEGYTVSLARNSITSLMDLRPPTATRLDNGVEQIVAVEELIVGDWILVKPGERIAMDGVILTGTGGVDQAAITGESIPVAKSPGDRVFAGTINGEGTLEVEISQVSADNTLNRIIRLVEEAQSVRAPSQRMIDRFAAWYTPLVVVAAALIATLPPLLWEAPLLSTPTEQGWLYRALAMLVIACPCALVISTPVTVMSAITAAARRGVLIKGGTHLESLGTIEVFAFDKTGTLTKGKPLVTQVRAVDCVQDPACERCDDVLALAGAVERRTSHPLADAVVRASVERQLDRRYPPAQNVEMLAGRGVRGSVGDRVLTLGSHRYFDDHYPHSDALCEQVRGLERDGQTTMLLADGPNVIGYLSLSDKPRQSSQQVVRELNGMGVKTVMLTGDHSTVAAAIGTEIGVTDVRAGLLPVDKVSAVDDLRAQHGHVAMVGDGINDTPALASATVGIAMGGAGSPQALETADIVLMADDLSQLPGLLHLSRFARQLIRNNILLSFGLKAVFLVLALLGATALWVAILADVGMAFLVTLNGMRPLRNKRTDDN